MTFDLNPIWLRRVATLLLAASLSVLIGAGSALAAGAPIAVDFDAAMRGVRFDPAKADGNLDATGKANGLLDSDEMALIAEKVGSVQSAQGVSVVAEYGFDTAPEMDIMMVPGGIGTSVQLDNPVYLDFLRRQDRTTEFTTSVCTGSALLAKAGLLEGRRATSNKMFFSMATSQDSSVNWIKRARWVEDGKYVTSSGVSAGTDMALGLVAKIYGKDRASALARSLEYQWSDNADHDPFEIQ